MLLPMPNNARMNDKQFDELLESVRDMGCHMHGETVAGVRAYSEPDYQ